MADDCDGCALRSPYHTKQCAEARAEQRVRFIEQYRSYVINYNLGKDMVAAHIEGLGGTPANPEKRWAEFARLISSPRLPSGLVQK